MADRSSRFQAAALFAFLILLTGCDAPEEEVDIVTKPVDQRAVFIADIRAAVEAREKSRLNPGAQEPGPSKKLPDRELLLSLSGYQKLLESSYQSGYSEPVKMRINDFKRRAGEAGLEILVKDFVFGLEAYSNSVPEPAVEPILYYEVKAIDRLLQHLIASGAGSMTQFSRDLIPGERGGPEGYESRYVDKYPVHLGFECSVAAFRNFASLVSNDKEFFYIGRELKEIAVGGDPWRYSGSETMMIYTVIDIVRFRDFSEVETAASTH
ncbi:MAG: Amuc_1100 family pilus-like protein [Verrucomicrobiales bacterium]|nr:Amuc_1100 family pilus-like protein [Verrucomicrobiales bacterium]